MGHGYEMPDGKIRAGYVPKEDLQKIYATNPRMTGWQKFLDGLYVPLVPTPEIIALGVGSSLLNGGISAILSSRWRSKTARSEGERRDLAEQFRNVIEFYQQKLGEGQK